MQRKTLSAVVLLVLAAALVGGGILLVLGSGDDAGEAGDNTGITVHDAWTAPNSAVTAVYLTITNGGEDDRLVGVSTDRAAVASLMGGDVAEVTHSADGVQPIALDVPDGTTELRPGAGHLMLQELTADLSPGDSFPLLLEFERSGRVEVAVQIVTWDEAADRSR